MLNRSRALREGAVRALAKVGLVWALAVLGFVFTAGAAVGSSPSPSAEGTHSYAFVNTGEAPRTAGLALALVVLGGGLTVLTIGSLRTPAPAPATTELPRLGTPGDLSLTLGLDLTPAPQAA